MRIIMDAPYLDEYEHYNFNLSDEDEDIIAVGGGLSPGMLISAYRQGIFPWFNPQDPIIWWSPEQRFVLYPNELHIGKTLKKFLRKAPFELSLDQAFKQVIQACSQSHRQGQEGTWISPDMRDAYSELHKLGVAHSVECWYQGRLAGGLYGLAMGSCFFGESMFSRMTGASKYAFSALVMWLDENGYSIIDCQQETQYLASFGARLIARKDFLRELQTGLNMPSHKQNWAKLWQDFPNSKAWKKLHEPK